SRVLHSSRTRRSSDLGDLTVIDLERVWPGDAAADLGCLTAELRYLFRCAGSRDGGRYIDDLQAAYLAESRQPVGPLLRRSRFYRSEEHTSELQSREKL